MIYHEPPLSHRFSLIRFLLPMCLIAFRLNDHPKYALVMGSNRDETYSRPTQPAHFWEDAPTVLAGRDEKAGGTWMGVTRTGRWAAVTNVRDPGSRSDDAPSRGDLVTSFLQDDASPLEYVVTLEQDADRYNGFNLVVGRMDEAAYLSNYDDGARPIEPGVHGLSNHLLNTAWPKVERATRRLGEVTAGTADVEAILDLLDDRECYDDERLPDTGIGQEAEKALSPVFIETDGYGTRASTVLIITHDGHVTFVERTFEEGIEAGTRRFDFDARERKEI